MRGIQADCRAPTIEGINGQKKHGQIMHLSRSVAAAAAACALAATMPQLAQPREIVGFSGSYSSGTVVVKTNEALLRARQQQGRALSGRRRPGRQAVDGHGLYQQQAIAPGLV